MSLFTPFKKLQKIENFNRKYENTKIITQITKNKILEENKIKKELKFRQKFIRSEISLNKKVYFI
jgi:hypothetical protein